MPSTRNARRGYSLIAIAGVLFVFNTGITRVLQAAGIESMTLTTVRCTGTAVCLIGVVLIRGERLHLPRGWRECVTVAAFGITGVALVQYLYFVAVDRLPVGIALLLEFTAPVLVALFSRFVYREALLKRVWLGIACSLGGLALVAQIWDGLTLDTVGVLAGLGAAVSLATYFLIGEHSVSDDPPLHVLTEAFIVAALFWNCLRPITALTDEVDLTAMQSFGGNLAEVSAPVWVLLVWLVVLGTVIPFLAELSSLQYLTATEVVLISMIEPAGAVVLGWLWFDESLTMPQTLGVLAILLGIALAQTARRGPVADQTPLLT